MRTLWSRICALFLRRQLDARLDEEVRAHLDELTSDYARRGLAPDQARLAARRAFGGVEQMKEVHRDRLMLRAVDDVWRDLRYAVRALARRPVFAAVAVITLALGIGANTALFALVNEHIFRPLPVPEPGNLVTFRWTGTNDVSSLRASYAYIAGGEGGRTSSTGGTSFSYPTFVAFRGANRTLDDLAAFAPSSRGFNAIVDGSAEFATGQYVSGNFYQALGVAPVAGRTLVPSDDERAAAPVATISEGYWARRFSRDPSAIGRTVIINGVSFVIAGVTPAELGDLTNRGTFEGPDYAMSFAMEPRLVGTDSILDGGSNWWVVIMGRLKPGVSLQQAEANFEPALRPTALAGWSTYVASLPLELRARPEIARRGTQVPRLRIVSASHGISDLEDTTTRQLGVLSAIFGLMLLIVCANLINLMLARASARVHEVSVRLAIGASRLRVMRQLWTESLVLGAVGGALGWPVAAVCRWLMPESFGVATLAPDRLVVVFACALSVLSAAMLGLLPAWFAVRSARGLRSPGAATPTTSSKAVGKPLMVGQIALSMVLVVSAVLFSRTLVNLRQVDVGFDAGHLATFVLEPGRSGYDRPRSLELYARIEERLRGIPGVRAVAVAGSGSGMLWGTDSNADVYIDGAAVPVDRNGSKYQSVDTSFFDTMGIRLRRGRLFTAQDTETSAPVAIVSESFARAFLANGNPLSRRIGGLPQTPFARQLEIVGVVSDSKVNSLRQLAPPIFYRPLAQTPSPSRTIIVRTADAPEPLLSAIANAVHTIEPRLAIRELTTQQGHLDEYVSDERTFAIASSFFGGLSLLVSAIGLFGLMSYSVARRTREIGIRMAVGAAPIQVLAAVMRETLVVVGIGVTIGIAVAVASSRLVAPVLFGLTPSDPPSIAGAAVLLICVAAIAGYLPARRAASVRPLLALRAE
jgi:predicted permease